MRGEIYNRERAKQLRDFSGLRFGKITPTDVDGLIDFGNKLFVLIEAKYKDTELPYGQRLALKRTCDAIQDAGKVSTVLIVSHEYEPSVDIDVANCMVVEYRYHREWHEPHSAKTCRQAIEKFLEIAGIPF